MSNSDIKIIRLDKNVLFSDTLKEYNPLSIYKSWLEYYKNTNNLSKDDDTYLPYYFGIDIAKRKEVGYEYSLLNEKYKTLYAFWAFDGHSDISGLIVELDDFIINPNCDAYTCIRELCYKFQEKGAKAIKLDLHCMSNFTHVLKSFDGIFTTDNKYCVIPIHMYRQFKYDTQCTFSFPTYNIKHVTNATLVDYREMHDFNYELNRKCDKTITDKNCKEHIYKTVLLFEKPMLIPNDVYYSYGLTFNISYNSKEYEATPEYLEFKRIEKLTAKCMFEYNKNTFTLLYGLKFVNNIKNAKDIECSHNHLCQYMYSGIETKLHDEIDITHAKLSKWLNQFSHIPMTKIVKSLNTVYNNTDKIYIHTVDSSISCDKLFNEENVDDIDYNTDENIVSGIYLIQEREHVIAKTNVYKFGRFTQQSDNYINRIRTGYKKGSKILLVYSVPTDLVINIENQIKTTFKNIFIKHEDGHEHFYGNPDEMKKQIISIIHEYI